MPKELTVYETRFQHYHLWQVFFQQAWQISKMVTLVTEAVSKAKAFNIDRNHTEVSTLSQNN